MEELEQSMHAYTAPLVFDAMAQKPLDTSGEVGTFVPGCHSPIGAIQGEDGSVTRGVRDIRDSVSWSVTRQSIANPVGNLSLELTAMVDYWSSPLWKGTDTR